MEGQGVGQGVAGGVAAGPAPAPAVAARGEDTFTKLPEPVVGLIRCMQAASQGKSSQGGGEEVEVTVDAK